MGARSSTRRGKGPSDFPSRREPNEGVFEDNQRSSGKCGMSASGFREGEAFPSETSDKDLA